MSQLVEALFLSAEEGEGATSSSSCALLSRSPPDMEVVVRGEDGEAAATIPCHRVVLAARCPYFKRALLSGMREDIERRVDVHDASPQIFKTFLRFVYCGRLVLADASLDNFAELLMLADR